MSADPSMQPTPTPPPLATGRAPRQALVFSGHMADAPGRPTPRLPATLLPAARKAIDEALDALDAGPADLALTQGAAGGDLLFAEACLARGVRVQLLLPLPEAEFIEQSVDGSDGDEDWRARYADLRARLADAPRVLLAGDGPPAKGGNAFERCNLWLLSSALAYGVDKLRFICLWDGGGGDGPGGTAHMYREVLRRNGRIAWIDTRRLDGGTQAAKAPKAQ